MYFTSEAQNLITNPSFEDIDSCYGQPADIGFDVFEWSGCVGWSCPTIGSSDLWCPHPDAGVEPPWILGFGYQNPLTGKSLAGAFTFALHAQNYREYIQNRLVSPLEANQYYQFSGYLSTNEDSINYSSCFQAYFSDSPTSSSDYLVLPLIPQWKNEVNNFIKDTVGWQFVSGVFKANGGEKYVTIGCFDDSINVHMLNKDPFTTSDIYYFIDDLSLVKAPINVFFPNVYTPNNDGVNEEYAPVIMGIEDYEVFIYNRWGNLMTKLTTSNPKWNGIQANEGTYFYVLKSELVAINEQGFFQLVR